MAGEASPEPVRELSFEVRAEYGLFTLVDPDAPLPWPFEGDTAATDAQTITTQTPAGVGFRSAARDFYPDLRIKIYDRPPDELPGPWNASGRTTVTVRSGQLYVRSIMGDLAGSFPLEPGPWELRWQVRGREEARRRSEDEGELFFHGAEEWVFQLWSEAQEAD